MVATIPQIIGKVNPKLYAKNGSELLKKYGSSDKIPAEEVKPQAITVIPDDTNPRYFAKSVIFDDFGGEFFAKERILFIGRVVEVIAISDPRRGIGIFFVERI